MAYNRVGETVRQKIAHFASGKSFFLTYFSIDILSAKREGSIPSSRKREALSGIQL